MKKIIFLVALVCALPGFRLAMAQSFYFSSSPQVGYDSMTVVAADFNGDGKIDLAGFDNNSVLTILTNNGNGGFSACSTNRYFFSIQSITAADVNHDGNANTDRTGTVGRNTYRGDPLANVDVRVGRVFRLREKLNAEFNAEVFNIANTLNVTDINTVYGAASFIGGVPQHFGDSAPAPLPSFGSVRATTPPRQLQLSVRLRF